jgi:hypothetical protein
MGASLIDLAGLLDLVLLVMAAEAVALFILHRRSGRGFSPGRMCRLLAPGAFLLLGWRVSLSGGNGPAILLLLTAALVMHGLDIRDRWKR